ncbi:MAG: hypothetical protein ACK5NN_13630, partial [Sphingomonadaceae bacterium]
MFLQDFLPQSKMNVKTTPLPAWVTFVVGQWLTEKFLPVRLAYICVGHILLTGVSREFSTTTSSITPYVG